MKTEEAKIIRFNKFPGLNTIKDPARLVIDRETVKLTTASNVDMCIDLAPSTRFGFRKVLSNIGKSIGPHGYCVLDGNLSQIIHNNNGSFSVNIIMPNVGNNPMVFADAYDRIYFTNNQIIGYIQNGIAYNIPLPIYQSSGLPITYKLPLPPGYLIEYAFGRLWIAQNNWVVSSDDGTGINRYDSRHGIGIALGSNLTMLKAVNDGIFASDINGVHFFSGRNPLKLDRIHLSDYPAIPGTAWTQRNLTLNAHGGSHRFSTAILFATSQGLCVGGDGGVFINLTEFEIPMPSVLSGTGIWRRINGINQYVCNMIVNN